MTIKIVKVLVATVSLAALVLGTDPGTARGGGGGHGGGRPRGRGGGRGGAGGAAVMAVAAATGAAEGISVVRILAVRVSVALEWAGLTSAAVISAACRAATSLTPTPRMCTDYGPALWAAGPLGATVPGTTGIGITPGTTGATTGGEAGTAGTVVVA